MPTTDEYDLAYPLGTAPANVPGDIKALADSVEVAMLAHDTPVYTAVTFNGAWTDFGTPYEEASYTKIGSIVYLRGLFKHGTTSTTGTVFTLPAGYRPAKQRHYKLDAGAGFAIVTLDSSGVFSIGSYTATPAGTAANVSLDGVSFDTAA